MTSWACGFLSSFELTMTSHWGRGDTREAAASGLVAWLRTEADGADSGVLQSHHAGWATSFLLGRLDEARSHAAAGDGLYEIDRHASLAPAYGNHDARPRALNFWARSGVLYGADDEAVRNSEAVATGRSARRWRTGSDPARLQRHHAPRVPAVRVWLCRCLEERLRQPPMRAECSPKSRAGLHPRQ